MRRHASWVVVLGAVLVAAVSGGAEPGWPSPGPRLPRAVVGPSSPALAAVLPAPADSQAAASLEQQIDACVRTEMRRISTPGASVAVILDGQTLLEKGYGIRNQTLGGQVGPATVFRIGSITKQLTAAALMQQVELRRAALDDPLERWVDRPLSSTRWSGSGLTVRHLLQQTSGIPDLPFEPADRTDDDALLAWAGTTLPVGLWSPPGAFWNYSNPNYVLAGLVAERASGTPFRTLLETRVFAPAGMTATTFDPARVVAGGDFAWGHYTDPVTGQRSIWSPADYDNAAIAPAGYALSTAPDLARWALLLMDGGGAVLTPGSASQMLADQVPMDYRTDQGYGYGVFREEYGGYEVVQHSGFIWGWGGMLLSVPQRRFAVAVLGNGPGSPTQAAYCVMDAVLNPTGAEPPGITTPPSSWDRYAGTYRGVDVLGRPFVAVVRLQGQQLRVTFTGLGATTPWTTTLQQWTTDTFLMDTDGDGLVDLDLTFVRSDGTGAPTRWLRSRMFVGERAGRLRRSLGR